MFIYSTGDEVMYERREEKGERSIPEDGIRGCGIPGLCSKEVVNMDAGIKNTQTKSEL